MPEFDHGLVTVQGNPRDQQHRPPPETINRVIKDERTVISWSSIPEGVLLRSKSLRTRYSRGFETLPSGINAISEMIASKQSQYVSDREKISSGFKDAFGKPNGTNP
jgi:hypothetical protein